MNEPALARVGRLVTVTSTSCPLGPDLSDKRMGHPAAARDLAVGPLRPLLVVEQTQDRPLFVFLGTVQPMVGVGAHGIENGIPKAALPDITAHPLDAQLVVHSGTVEAVSQDVARTVIEHDQRRKAVTFAALVSLFVGFDGREIECASRLRAEVASDRRQIKQFRHGIAWFLLSLARCAKPRCAEHAPGLFFVRSGRVEHDRTRRRITRQCCRIRPPGCPVTPLLASARQQP